MKSNNIRVLQALRALIESYEELPTAVSAVNLAKALTSENFAFALGHIIGDLQGESLEEPSLTEREREYAEKYQQILRITSADNQPRAWS